MKRRWPLYLICLVVVVVVFFAGTTTWLVGTESGTRFVLETAAEHLPVTIDEPAGTFADGFSAKRIEYQSGSTSVVIDAASLQLDLWSLATGTAVEIRYLLAQSVVVSSSGEAESGSGDLSVPAAPLPVRLHRLDVGRIAVNQTEMSAVKMAGEWGTAGVEIQNLSLNVADTDIETSLTLDSEDLPGIAGSLRWSRDGLKGNLKIAGNIAELEIDHILHFQEIDVATVGGVSLGQLPAVSAQLEHSIPAYQTKLTTRISGSGEAWDTTIVAMYQDIPLEMDAAIYSENDSWYADVSNGLVAGAVEVGGKVGLDYAELDVVVGSVQKLLPTVSGTVRGKVSFDGNVVSVQATAQPLQVDSALTFQDVTLSGRYNLAKEHLQARLDAASLTAAQTRIASPRFDIEGGVDDFRYRVRWQNTDLAGTGSIAEETLHLQVGEGARLTLEDNSIELASVLKVSVAPERIVLSQHCWLGVVQICGQGAREETGALDFSGTVSAPNVAEFVAIPVTVEPQIGIAAEWRLSGTMDAPLADVEGRVNAFAVSQDQVHASLPEIEFIARLEGDDIQAQVTGSDEHTSLEGSLNLRDVEHVDGRFAVETDLGKSLQLPEEILLAGLVNGTLSVSGLMEELTFQGQGSWTGDFAWNDQALNNIEANWQVRNEGWRLSGKGVPTQGGYLHIAGEGDGYSLSSNIQASVDGENLTIASDIWEITAAPDIDLTVRDGDIEFNGLVRVPRARAEIKTLPPSLPKPSRDVVVVGRTKEEEADTWRGKARVVLEDDVRLKLFLLDIGLSGQLDAEVIGEEVASLRGELRIPSGVLEASGQKLSITEGRVIFTGDPTNPYVDIVALREIDNVTPVIKVGLRIVGLSDELTTTVYSEPRMNEARALSFLITGRDLANPSDAETNHLLNAALGFGIKQSAGVVQELRKRVGLDELTALSNEQNQVAIVAGKQITEDLHVRYTYNALSAIGALVIRYHLSDRWRLEATNDQTSSMDLLYEFSK